MRRFKSGHPDETWKIPLNGGQPGPNPGAAERLGVRFVYLPPTHDKEDKSLMGESLGANQCGAQALGFESSVFRGSQEERMVGIA